MSGDTPSLISSSAEFDSRLRKKFFGRWCSGSARLSEAQQVLVQLQVSRPLEKFSRNFGPIVHGYLGNSFIGKWGSNPLSRRLENSVNDNLPEAVIPKSKLGNQDFDIKHSDPKVETWEPRFRHQTHWGMGQSVGQQPLKLFIVSVRVRLPLPFWEVA